MVAALGIVQIVNWGSSYYLLAVLAQPISRDTGWAYSWVIAGLSLGLFFAGLVSVRVGRMIEARRGRSVFVGSAVLLALGLCLLAAAQNIPSYLLAWIVLGFGMGAGLYDAAFSTLGRLYGMNARGAIATLTLWGGFASTVCWPLSAALVEHVGWRGAALSYAGLHLFLTLPLCLAAIPVETPRPAAPIAKPEATTTKRPDARQTIIFDLLAAILTMAGAIAALWSVHLITILRSGGLTFATAIGLGALVGPAQVGARVIEIAFTGRFHPIWKLQAGAVLIAVGLGMLWAGFMLPAVALIAYGAGNGIWSIARGTVPMAIFGPDGYAILMGRLAMPSLVAQSLAPTLGAILIARYGAQATLGFLSVLALANMIAIGALLVATGQVCRSA